MKRELNSDWSGGTSVQDLWRAAVPLVDTLRKGFRKGSVGVGALTLITVQLSLHCVQLRQLIERSAFVRSGRHGSTYLEHGSPAESRIVAGASVFVENGAPATRTSGDTKASAILGNRPASGSACARLPVFHFHPAISLLPDRFLRYGVPCFIR